MTLRRGITLGLIFLAQSLAAQGPTVGSSATAARRLIPVLDDYGQLITEDAIRRTMHEPNYRKLQVWAMALVAGASFQLLRPHPPQGADCSIYAPCTPREKFYKDKSFVVGAVVGFMFGVGTINDGGIDRWQAVQIIRAQRRSQHNAATPP